MRLGPRALAILLVSVLLSCGKVKPTPLTCPIAVADGGATRPDAAGVDRGAYSLEGANNTDWADIAVGPCPGGTCVYIADMGDDPQIRADYVVYRVPEPFTLSSGEHAVPFEALRFAYPDGKSHDAQTLLIHPVTGLLTIVTKDHSGSGVAFVYDFPTSQPSVTTPSTLIRRGQLSPPTPLPPPTRPTPLTGEKDVIDGDVHPQGLAVLLRTHTDLYFYPMQPEQTVATALGGTPCSLRVAEEDEQGKAVGWLRAGSGYVTVGEGQLPDLNVVACETN